MERKSALRMRNKKTEPKRERSHNYQKAQKRKMEMETN
jgi:hypothetical protein